MRKVLLQKIGDIREPFYVKMDVIKDRDSKALTDTEEIKKRWQKYTQELCKKGLNDLDNHDGHLPRARHPGV